MGPRAPSFQCLSATLSIVMLIASGAVVGYMSVTTAESALDASGRTRDRALAASFRAGEDNVAEVAAQMMQHATGSAAAQTRNYLEYAMGITDSLSSWLRQQPPALVQSWQWFDTVLRARLYHDFKVARRSYISGLSVLTLQGDDPGPHYLVFGEEPATMLNPADGYHALYVLQHDGQPGRDGDADWGSPQSPAPRPGCNILISEVDEFGRPAHLDRPCNLSAPLATNGRVPMGDCGMCFGGWSIWMELVNRSMGRGCVDTASPAFPPWEQRRCVGRGGRGDGSDPLTYDPPDTLLWSPCMSGGPTLKNYAYATWTHADQPQHAVFGKRVGYASVFLDSRAISTFLRSLDIPSGSRMYAVERSPWTRRVSQIVGATHGDSWILVDERRGPMMMRWAYARDATNATDPIIRQHAEDILPSYGDAGPTLDDGRLYRWSDHSGERWFVKSGRIEPSPGGVLWWWVLLLVPRRTVMRMIDEASEAAAVRIDYDHAAMEADRRSGAELMYGVTACVGLLLMVGALLLSRLIVAPLRSLQDRMAQVAAMQLDGAELDIALDTVLVPREVRDMQDSFDIMVEQLRTYKSYLPESCLLGEQSMSIDEDYESSYSDSSSGDKGMNNIPSVGTIGSRQQASCGIRLPDDSVLCSVLTLQAADSTGDLINAAARKNSLSKGAAPSISLTETSVTGIGRGKSSVTRPRTTETSFNSRARSLAPRRLALVCSNWRGSVPTYKTMSGVQLEQLTHLQLTVALGCCRRTKVVFDSFCCDRYRYSANGARPCPAHRAVALRFVTALLRDVATFMNDEPRTPVLGSQPLGITVAAASGSAMCGDVGCPEIRRYDVLGCVAGLAPALERTAAALSLPALCDAASTHGVGAVVFRRLPQQLVYKGAPSPIEMWQVMGDTDSLVGTIDMGSLQFLNDISQQMIDANDNNAGEEACKVTRTQLAGRSAEVKEMSLLTNSEMLRPHFEVLQVLVDAAAPIPPLHFTDGPHVAPGSSHRGRDSKAGFDAIVRDAELVADAVSALRDAEKGVQSDAHHARLEKRKADTSRAETPPVLHPQPRPTLRRGSGGGDGQSAAPTLSPGDLASPMQETLEKEKLVATQDDK